MLTAMIDAVEAGDLHLMKELLDTANHYDVNLTNKVPTPSGGGGGG